MDKDSDWGFSTRALHIGQGPDPETGAVVQPIHMATTFAQQGVGQHKGYEYSRTGNPTRNALEENLAALEDAKHCLAFASGLGAETTLLLLLGPGDHVVYMEDVYGGTFRLFDKVLK
ncbi:MAG TPA: PLP-dependent transferase, partial [Candidatus Dormibacteraeota bacterium]|nr:PLP-dependent transferase [Candidatus Dormibacteraeota bacterium]